MPTTQTITLRLDRLEELFVAPEPAPFEGRFGDRSGVERLAAALESSDPRSWRRPLRVTLAVPGGSDGRDVSAALAGYCDSQLETTTAELARLRHAGLIALRLGLLVLAICVLLSSVITAMTMLPDFVSRVIGESLAIAGWVVLWRPLELLLFDTWPVRRRLRRLAAIRTAELDIVDTAAS